MLFPAEQAFVGRDEKRAPLKMPAWEAIPSWDYFQICRNLNYLSPYNYVTIVPDITNMFTYLQDTHSQN